MAISLQNAINENDIIRTLDGIVYTLDPVTTLATTASVTSLSQTPTAQTSSTFVTSYISMVSATNSIVEQSTRKLSNKKTSLIIGLTIGCSVTLVLLVLVLLFLLNKNKKCHWFHLKKTRQTRAWKPGYFGNEKTGVCEDVFDVDENSVTMHYKVLKNSNNYGHVKTPQQAYNRNRNNTSQTNYSNEKNLPHNTLQQQDVSSLYAKNIDRYLYERPPQIQQISSEIPSSNSSQENVNSGKCKPTWRYGSPLSKWFLGSSTYLAQDVQNSPQINLKDFKLQRNYDERSPILASNGDNTLYGVIQKQSTSTNKYKTFPTGNLQLQAISPEKIKRNKSKLSRKNTLLKKRLKDITKHLIEIQDQKPLPQAPFERKTVDIKEYRKSTYLETMTLYEVICEYTPQLLDELHIIPGEYVKVLATHTDGWCLVERSNYFVKMNANIDGEDYLNENRGIVPLSHLKRL